MYPVLQGQDHMDDIVARHREEADELGAAIRRLDRAGFGTDAWREHFESLEQLVSEHVDEEETTSSVPRRKSWTTT